MLLSVSLKNLTDYAIEKNELGFFNVLYFIVSLALINIVFSYIQTKTIGYYTEYGLAKLRGKVGKKLSIIPFSHLTESHTGDYVSRATNDMANVKTFTTLNLPYLISIPLTAIGALTCLFILSWKLTLFSLVLIPVLIVVSSLLSLPMGPISKKMQATLGKVNSIVTDFIKGIEVSKAYLLERPINEKHDKSVLESVKHAKNLAKRESILDSVSSLMSIIPFVVSMILGGYLASKGEISAGGLLAFIALLNAVTFPISYFPTLIGQSKIQLVSAERIFEIIDDVEERKTGTDFNFNLNNHKRIIEFRDVTFTYPNQNETLFKGLSFKVDYGESVAFVGASGCGKSTIMKLILGYYEDYEGEIFIGGHELKEWDLDGLRNKMALVSQDTFLFPVTIEENIRYGSLDATDDELIYSTKQANADCFITGFKKGYLSEVGELGNSLSGGQKQRLTIARAILKNAPIFLLDEATSSLDTESEQLITEALDRFMSEKTSIVVAHRLQTIKQVDRIYVMQNGKIIEEGKHDVLIAKNSVYTSLYKKQMKSEVDSSLKEGLCDE
ncbi:ABC transporter ATP-binding protein [Mycoplasmatota bacterium]|nr:ABC transporter ATP-binding protein [Mycoplasmatota bacterium]